MYSYMTEFQDELKNKSLTLCSQDALNYSVNSVIGSAIAQKETEPMKNKNKTHWSDRIECNICGGIYTRSASTAHKKTKIHKLHCELNEKIKNILLN